MEVLTKRKTVTSNDKLILPYSLSEVSAALGSHGVPRPKNMGAQGGDRESLQK